MIRIIALSDTHLDGDLPKNLVELIRGADIIMHAGDFVSLDIYESIKDLGKIEAVCGNADSSELRRILPDRKVVDVEGIKIGLVHRASHSSNPLGAEMMAREMEVDVIIYGHLHRPYVERGNRLLVCPGSPIVPRMSPPTVAEIKIDGPRVNGRIVSLGKTTCDYILFAESLARSEQ